MGVIKKPLVVSPAQLAELQILLPGRVRTNVPLSKLSRWKIGGEADVVVTPATAADLATVKAWLCENELPSVVIGSTSNLLFDDAGLRAIMIHMTPAFGKAVVSGHQICVEAGAWVPGLARLAMKSGLAGLEHTCGIPGTVGGLVYMNGGSQRKGIGDCVMTVDSISSEGKSITRSKEECNFEYRKSVFQDSAETISSVTLKLHPRPNNEIRREMLAILKSRRNKFPQKEPNCGSVFVSNPQMYDAYGPPGQIIENLGLKGVRVGGALVSPLHANFIINDGTAKAEDVLALISRIKDSVLRSTGYDMAVEAKYVSQTGEIVSI